MGQQQLLLLVLGIVIVGLAVVVGIQAFGENQKKANADALVNDAIRIASDAQAWKLKPAAFGGGANETGFENLSLPQMGYELTDGAYENLNGRFSIAATAASVIITGNSLPDSGNDNQVVVTVAGTAPTDIGTVVSTVDDASGS
ncbi:MAG: hypothetical protein WD021_09395 [Rhodothermales bacterium]